MTETRGTSRARSARRTLSWSAGVLTMAVAAGLLTAVPGQAVSGGTVAADGTYAYVAKINIGSADSGGRSCTGALIDGSGW